MVENIAAILSVDGAFISECEHSLPVSFIHEQSAGPLFLLPPLLDSPNGHPHRRDLRQHVPRRCKFTTGPKQWHDTQVRRL